MSKLWVLVLVILSLGTVGCKRPPAYVGNFDYGVLSAAQKQQEDTAFAKASREERDLIDKVAAAAKTILTVNADGEFAIKSGTGKLGASGTYTVEGNKLTLTDTSGSWDSSPRVFTFNEADQTLTVDMRAGGPSMVLKEE